MKKIFFACAGHSLNDERVTYKEARSLARLGYDVIVCGIGVSGFSEKTVKLIDVDTMQVVDGEEREEIDGGRFRRIVRLRNIKELIKRERPDLVVAHEFETAFLAWWLKRQCGLDYVFDVHECYEQTMYLIFPRVFQGLARWFLWKLQRKIVSASCGITVATPGCAAYAYAKELHLPCEIIHNSPRLEYFPFREDEGEMPIFVHDGNLTCERGALEILDALAILKKKFKFRLMLLGKISDDVREEFQKKVERLRLENYVDSRGRLPWTEFGAIEATGQIGLICSRPIPNHMLGLPNKLYNYMACGLSVLAMKGSKCGEIVKREKCGVVAEPANPQSIAQALAWLIEHPEERRQMARNGRKAIEEKYSWERMEEVMKDFYGNLRI